MLGLPGAIIPMTRQWGEPVPMDGELFHFELESEAERIEASFLRWLERVEATVPPERLMVLENPYGDAYEKVCGALQVPMPTRPWPHVNDKAQTRVAVLAFNVFFYLFPLLTVAVVFGFAGALLLSSQWLPILVSAVVIMLILVGLKHLMQRFLENAARREKAQRTD